ncbi:MAG: hypothetical protein M3114_08025, partial [Thermoproteota archaeon]|nr:hypothetical protein [Thermoproteota archaeon]
MKMSKMPLLFTIWLRSGSVSENVLGIVYARDPKNIYTHTSCHTEKSHLQKFRLNFYSSFCGS